MLLKNTHDQVKQPLLVVHLENVIFLPLCKEKLYGNDYQNKNVCFTKL